MSDLSPNFSKSCQIEEANWDSLPHEIRTDMLLRLPIKTVFTCTSVSKSWNSLIKSSNFISTHLNRKIHSYYHSATHPLLLREVVSRNHLAPFGEKEEVYSLHWDNEAFHEYKRFDFPFQAQRSGRDFLVVGTCNGLVCLSDDLMTRDCNFFVWNPCIRKYVTLPTVFLNIGYYTGSGFGFDSKTNDYKVVRIVTPLDEQRWHGGPEVMVYSLATGKWKMGNVVPPRCILSEREPRQAFVNGAVHWVAKTYDGFRRNFILVFDLGDENFREIMLPKDLLNDNCRSGLSVSVLGESLAVYRRMTTYPFIHIWVMKEYGVLESWTKVLTVDSQVPEVEVPWIFCFKSKAPEVVGFRKSGGVVIETEAGNLVSLDHERNKIKHLILRNLGYSKRKKRNSGYRFTFVDPYVESLVLLENPQGAVSY